MFTIDCDGTFQGMIAIKPSGLKSWEGSITFAVCTVGFVLGLPIATEVLCMDRNSIRISIFVIVIVVVIFASPGGSVCCLFPRLHPWLRLVGHGPLPHSGDVLELFL